MHLKKILIVLIIALLIYSALSVPHEHKGENTRSENPFVVIIGNKFYLNGKVFVPKGVNYFPRDYGWIYMWQNFSKIQDVIDQDMKRAKALGINVVRIIIQYSAFNGSNVNSWDLAKLDKMLGILDKYNMKGLVTLLDWTNPKDNLNDQLAQVRAIVTHFKDDPRIFAWDIRNEPDHFYYGGWSPYVSKPDMLSYLYSVLQEVKKDDTNHLVTVGEYGWYLGDRNTPVSYPVNDDFGDGNYNGWDVVYGSWSASSGYLEGSNGAIKIHDTSWWSKPGYTIFVKMRTLNAGGNNWDVARIRFRYINEDNYYALLLKKDGNLELAKMQDGTWHPYLANQDTGLNCSDWHEFKIISFRNETEVYVDGTRYLYYWDYNPINNSGSVYGGIALEAENSTADFDDVQVRLGPSVIGDDIFKDVDFPIFHWYEDSSNLKYVLNELENHTDRPILMEEIGRPTNGTFDDGTPCPYDESSVAQWLSEVLSTIKQYDNVYPSVWDLNDYSPNAIPGMSNGEHPEHYFGLYRRDYSLKPSGAVYRDQFEGTQLKNDAAFISSSHPSSMNCNERTQVSVTFKNTGDTYWNASRDYRLGSRQPRDNQIWDVGRADMDPSTIAYPNDEYTFNFNITAPSVPGKYSFSWRMLREHVEWFGDEYDDAIKVNDPNLTTLLDDEFNDMSNWNIAQGTASTSNGLLNMDPNTLVLEKDQWSELYISYRAYSSEDSSWKQTLTFVKAHDSSLKNYLAFTLYENGYAEIYYVVNNEVHHNISYAQTSLQPNEYHTFYIDLHGGIMKVYIDGSLLLSSDVSSYPYYQDTDYIGFYSGDEYSHVDHAGIYAGEVPEISGGIMAIMLLFGILTIFIRKIAKR